MGIDGFRTWFGSQFPEAIEHVGAEPMDFDHVLIDVNPILHSAVRLAGRRMAKKKKDDDYLVVVFRLIMTELDTCLKAVVPKHSLVLAMDGSPGAAKVATQRQRRFSSWVRAERKTRFSKRFATVTKGRMLKESSQITAMQLLAITPGTEFMERVEECLLYWAWQRLQSPNNVLSKRKVSIYISTSNAPGEGEIKLVDWIFFQQQNNKRFRTASPARSTEDNRSDDDEGSLVIVGGDSDLVLEALVLPPSFCKTHNVFVLLPDDEAKRKRGHKMYLAVSVWEVTRSLARVMGLSPSRKHQKARQQGIHPSLPTLMQVRTDLVLISILSGNDYLPRLRGSGGLHRVFNAYRRKQGQNKSFLVNPNTLNFNARFARDFFDAIKPSKALDYKDATKSNPPSQATNHLDQLNRLVSMHFAPGPCVWTLVHKDDNSSAEEGNNVDDKGAFFEFEDVDHDAPSLDDGNDDALGEEDDYLDNEEEDENDEKGVANSGVLLRLSLGNEGSEDYCVFEAWHEDQKKKLQETKNELAKLALENLLEANFDEHDDDDATYDNINSSGYAWEKPRSSTEPNVEAYLYGLLWNLQTYQDGVCADYGYNYGRRMAPTGRDLADFFQNAVDRACSTVGKAELLMLLQVDVVPRQPQPHPAVSPGVSCLAVMPPQAVELVPEPYRWISQETVEAIYAECMGDQDGVFKINTFEDLCEETVATIRRTLPKAPQTNDAIYNGYNNTPISIASTDGSWKPQGSPWEPKDGSSTKPILTGRDFWTILVKSDQPLQTPFRPPRSPLSSSLSNGSSFAPLIPNRRIIASRQRLTVHSRIRNDEKGKSTLHNKVQPRSRASTTPAYIDYTDKSSGLLKKSGGSESLRNLKDVRYRKLTTNRNKKGAKVVKTNVTSEDVSSRQKSKTKSSWTKKKRERQAAKGG